MKQRLIDVNALCELARNHVDGTVDCNDIMRFSPVDAVPVVRCRECKYWNRLTIVTSKNEHKGLCEHPDHIMATREDFYCADGKEKDDEHTEND